MPRKKYSKIKWIEDKDVKRRISDLVNNLDLDWIQTDQIFCYKSQNSSAHAYARIWGLSKIWQMSLNQKPAYIIEVLSEKYDHLNDKEKDVILLHEISHIPKNFSGSLLPHIRKRGKRNFNYKLNLLIKKYKRLR